MKNNRQIGLDGKIFISTSIHRGTFFVFMLMLYGIANAVADILKLTGESGVAMGAFTTTLLIYDFIVSLMLVVVVFYAYFLECGADVPVIKEKPLMIFGLFRLGYYLLLSYYLCYRALYCMVNRDSVSIFQGIFYIVYLCLIVLLILANCYIFNIVTRNLIRRSYEKSFHHLAIAGFVVQALMPIAYILARIFMKDVGDEYFTSAISDLIRLLISPMMLTSIWFLFLHAVSQVHDIYSEVDTALKSKRYQITYTSETSGKNSRKGAQKTTVATATILPAGANFAELNPSTQPRELKPASTEKVNVTASEPEITPPAVTPTVSAPIVQEVTNQVTSSTENPTDSQPDKTTSAQPDTDTTADVASDDDEVITTFATEARKAVAKTVAQNKQKQTAQQSKKPTNGQNSQKAVHALPVLPVQEFDPYPAASLPRQSAKTPQNAPNRQNAPHGKKQLQGRPNMPQTHNQPPKRTGSAPRPQQPQQQQRGVNPNRTNAPQNRPQPNGQYQQNRNNQQPGPKGKQSKKR